MALAYIWVYVSEDLKVGKHQKLDHFLGQVLKRFHKEIKQKEYHIKDQVYSKRGKTNKEIILFNNNMHRQWKNGESGDVL